MKSCASCILVLALQDMHALLARNFIPVIESSHSKSESPIYCRTHAIFLQKSSDANICRQTMRFFWESVYMQRMDARCCDIFHQKINNNDVASSKNALHHKLGYGICIFKLLNGSRCCIRKRYNRVLNLIAEVQLFLQKTLQDQVSLSTGRPF